MAQSALMPSGTRVARLLCACAAWGAWGCDGALVNLGSSERSLSGGGAGGASAALVWQIEPEPVVQPVDGLQLANPTLTADGQKLYYSNQQRGGGQQPNATGIAVAVPRGARFDNALPVVLGDLKTSFDASSPAISPAGTELWLGMLNTSGDTDIWLSTGSADKWSTPSAVGELNSNFDDVPRPPALGGTLMPLSSKRHGGIHYQIYLASRARTDAPWGTPNQDFLANIDSPAFQSADGFLSEDGLTLYFSSTRRRGIDSDLYVAQRASIDAAFGVPEPLADLQSDFEERMPWVSSDGQQLYFASNRAGQYTLYRADRVSP